MGLPFQLQTGAGDITRIIASVNLCWGGWTRMYRADGSPVPGVWN
ncbi:hypothetical protein [Rhizobium rhizogenes]|nr:hypothetical protein [Rhizobium rhizogenes]